MSANFKLTGFDSINEMLEGCERNLQSLYRSTPVIKDVIEEEFNDSSFRRMRQSNNEAGKVQGRIRLKNTQQLNLNNVVEKISKLYAIYSLHGEDGVRFIKHNNLDKMP